jgi:hypothetical protein
MCHRLGSPRAGALPSRTAVAIVARMSETETVRGSCLCGGVAWQAKRPFELMSHCHCSMCRKSHGSAFATYVGARADGYRMLQGEELIAQYPSSEHGVRRFCSRCGSIVPNPVEGERAWMPAGCLEDDPGTRPVAHIFVASKAPWYEIPDALPRFDAYPPGYGAPAIERPQRVASGPGWVHGSCLCNDVAYEITAGGWTLMQCHCSRCRKARGAAHGTNLFVDAARFAWLRGEQTVRPYKVPEAARYTQAFCTRCGSSMPRPGGAFFVVPAGSLDGDPGITARKHIFCGSKAPWFTIADAWPQYETLPPQQ